MSRPLDRRARRAVAATAVTALVCAGAAAFAVTPASAADDATDAPASLTAGRQDLTALAGASGEGRSLRPLTPGTLGIPESGDYTFLVELRAPTVASAFRASRREGAGTDAARDAAEAADVTVTSAQDRAIAALPARTPVLYRTRNALSGFAVRTDVTNADALQQLPGVEAVYPVATKYADNATAIPLQGAPQVWEGGVPGHTGEGVKVGIIDTGIDYTHADFGGPGTPAAYQAANAAEAQAADPALFGPGAPKVKGGYDFAGDAYNADPADPATYSPVPQPDANPLDCNGHGSHVAGSAAGLGVTADGATYAGEYSTGTPFDDLRIGPGMAPGADLYALRVFGCDGSTDITSAAIDWAVDPNGDGDPSDHLDVINMSLGSAYGSPLDGDAVVTNAAADLGVLSTVSAGNEGDVYDIGGSPGVAAKALTVASSVDSGNVVDTLDVTIDGAPATYNASRSIAYDWTTQPDLTGTVAQVSATDTGCDPYDAADAATVAGKIVVVTWTDGAGLECGSVTRSANIAAAGGTGFIFANSAETFSAGITGSAVIPGVLVSKSGGDAIRAALTAGSPVVATGTAANAGFVDVPGDVDKISDFTSRGSRVAGNLKPDVAAVGASVFSAAVGTGSEGVNESGTSMAAPMTAGLSALVLAQHPEWTPAQVKADIMNTAGADLFVDGSADPASQRYAPNRVGAGRIEAVPALANDVLAYVADDDGAVSVSFGPVEVTGPTSLTKTVTVQNTGTTRRVYDTSYEAITSVRGVAYDVSPAQVQVPAGATRQVTVTLQVPDPTRLDKTVDPTHGRLGASGLPLETLADASGLMVLTPSTGDVPALRVPVYSAPRPASQMTQPASVPVVDGTATLTTRGTPVSQASGDRAIRSIGAGLELQAVSGQAPTCSPAQPTLCVVTESDRPADLQYVGTTVDQGPSTAPADRMLYFGVSAHAPASTPVGKVFYEVYLDTDDDLVPDLVAYTANLAADQDIFVVNLQDLGTGELVDTELLDNRFGDTDVAAFDSEVQLLPVLSSALAAYGVDAAHPRVSYGVLSYSGSSARLTDQVGFGDDLESLSGDLSVDTVTPGLTVTDAAGDGPLFLDRPQDLTITRDAASYARDHALGAMLVHLHNKTGEKVQVVQTGITTATTLTATPAGVTVGSPVALAGTVGPLSGSGAPTGTVDVIDTVTREVVANDVPLVAGSYAASWTPTAVGTYSLQALYSSGGSYAPSSSPVVPVTVTAVGAPTDPTTPPGPPTGPPPTPPTVPVPPARATPDLDVKLTFKRGRTGSKTKVKVDLRTAGQVTPTGAVKFTVNGKKVEVKTLRNGRTGYSLRPQRSGVYKIRVVYKGDARYVLVRSRVLTYTAT